MRDTPVAKKYLNESHAWMDKNILKSRQPDLYGYLILVDHKISANEIWDMLQYWSEQYLNAGVHRTLIFHRIIDDEISDQIEADIQKGFRPYFCYKGCANCCYQPVACTDEEAQLIYRYCKDQKIDIDFDKIQRQIRYMQFDSLGDFTGETNWNEQNEEDQSCIFLNKDDQTCSIWMARPFVCRVHIAEKTNQYCKTFNGAVDPNARGIHYPQCSYILSSVFTIHHDSIGKMMGPLLLMELKKGKKTTAKSLQ